MYSFISDERGVIEPYTELPAMALAVVGFIVFIAVLTQAYGMYQEKSFIADHYQDAANLAEKLGNDIALTGGRSGIVDSVKLEELKNEPGEIFEKYSSYYDFLFKIESNSEYRQYSIVIKSPGLKEPKLGVSASIPITVKLNDVVEQPGTITVKIWEKK